MRELILALLRNGTVESDGWREAPIPGAAKKNKPHISLITKATHQHYSSTTTLHE
jgi:hypothetical protein